MYDAAACVHSVRIVQGEGEGEREAKPMAQAAPFVRRLYFLYSAAPSPLRLSGQTGSVTLALDTRNLLIDDVLFGIKACESETDRRYGRTM